MRRFVCAVAAILLIAPAFSDAAKHQRIESAWLDRPIAIDGDSGDWAGPLVSLDDKHPLSAAVENDGQSLYLVLSTSDASVRRQILRQGFTVWFDPAGGEKKHFGIKYPVGIGSDDEGFRGRGGRTRGGYGRPRDPNSPPDQPDQIEPADRLEVYGPAKDDAHSFVAAAAQGITVKVGQTEGYFVYELKVPLEKTSGTPYAIEARPGTAIGLGLETPKVERPQQRTGGFGGGMGGGIGGRGGMGGRGGRGGHREGFEPPKPLKLWTTVQLAARK